MIKNYIFGLVSACVLCLMSVPASAAVVYWVPTNADVNYVFTLDSGYSLAMFDVDDFDASKTNPLLIDNGSDGTGAGEGFDTVVVTAAGSDYTATSDKSGDSITLFNDPQFVIALTDNGGNWFEPTTWAEVALNLYDVTFSNGDVLQIDAIPTVVETAVPVPAAVWLFGSGLLGLAGIARRKRDS